MATAVVAAVASVALVVPASTAGATGAGGRAGRPWSARANTFSSSGSHAVPGFAPDPLLVPGGRSPHLESPRSKTPEKSLNWSGEVDTGKKFTQVSGEWTVPSVTPATPTSLTATWIGIGGADGDHKLVQTGTLGGLTGTSTAYIAWYEMLPTTLVLVGTVTPGDLMRATITQDAATTWTVSIRDVTRNGTFTKRFTYTAGAATTAEWIVERPVIATPAKPTTPTAVKLAALAPFGTARFTHMQADLARPAPTSVVPLAMAGTPPRTTRLLAYPGPTATTTTGSFTDFYVAPPTVTGVSPSQGPTAGGTNVTISGAALIPGLVTSVHFGSASASFSVTPSGSVVATSPAGSVGTVDVIVTTTEGTSAATAADRFTYTVPPQPPEPGYDLVGSDGGVFVFPPPGTTGGYYGSLPGLGVTPAKPIVGMVPTVTDKGYFLVGSDGGVFAFGTAPFLGSLPGIGATPRFPITGIVAADTDKGYFLVGADGGVFAFGTVPFLGSLPGEHVSVSNIVGIAATPNGTGYWLVSTTGTVYAFGKAKSLGTAKGSPTAVSAIAGTPTGGGYWVTTRNGTVYSFGNAKPHGTLPGLGVSPALSIIGIVHSTATGGAGGYWLIGADGGVFAFGTVPFIGSLPGLSVHVDDIVGAVPTSS